MNRIEKLFTTLETIFILGAGFLLLKIIRIIDLTFY